MIKTLENETLKSVSIEKDTWILEVPAEVCEREGFAEGTLVSMTFKNSGIKAKFISPPAKELLEIGRQILEEDRELFMRLKDIGD